MNQPAQAPFLVRPRLDAKPWGGTRLTAFGAGDATAGDTPRIGEAVYTAGDAIVASGPLAGRSLAELAAERPEALVGRRGPAATSGHPVFPLLVKLIDAAESLSVQVHPTDATAPDGGIGKTEAWHVVAADPGAALYLGLFPGTTLDEFAAACAGVDGRTVARLRRVPAVAGETILIPAGTVHALGAGVLVYEVQQPSDVTYRLDDWGRLGLDGRPRELHLAAGLAVTDPALRPEPIRPVAVIAGSGRRQLLAACRSFALERIALAAGERAIGAADDSPQVVTCLRGAATVTAADGQARLGVGQTAVVPSAGSPCDLRAEAPCVLLRAWVPDLPADIVGPARRSGAADADIAALAGPLPDLRVAMAADRLG